NGDQVLFELKDDEDFMRVFWGCIVGGMIGTPVCVLGVYDEMNEGVKKVKGVLEVENEGLIIRKEGSGEEIGGVGERFE
ncbi:hypothetical protein, partial [Bacillus altitudinis]|uniref:hypothetical protein n=1 Tax=Bacillus altitudinis TaxID=293387 RepID=UPI001C92F640